MVFHLNGEALVIGIHGRPLRHRPGFQHVAGLQPEVPVQARGGVLLHHEQAPARGRHRRRRTERLRRRRCLSFLAIGIQAAAGIGVRLRRLSRSG